MIDDLDVRRAPVVWVIGESIMDVVTDAKGITTRVPGGSPANVAVGLSKLGVRTCLTTALGPDADGIVLESWLRDAGVVLAGTSVLPRTSTSVAVLDLAGAATYSFDLDWQLPELAPVDRPDLVHVGSISAFLEPGATTLAGWIAALSPETVVTFDPNIRPAVLDDVTAALAKFEAICSRANIVKLSDEDARWLYPLESPEAIASRIRHLGCESVIVTLGPAGALVSTASSVARLDAVPNHVVDTVGAGDSFMSGMLAALVRGHMSLQDSLEFAAHCASITVSRRGADLPTATDVVLRLDPAPEWLLAL